MNLISLLDYDETVFDKWVGKLDVRIKFMYALSVIIYSLVLSSPLLLLMYFVINQVIYSFAFGVRSLLSFYYHQKYFIILIFIINFYLNSWNLDITISLVLKLMMMLNSFSLLNRSTRPDGIIDMLIKLKIPPNMAWSIGTSLRQAMFLVEEMNDIQDIQGKRLQLQHNSFKRKIQALVDRVSYLFINFFSNAVNNAAILSDVLISRKFNGAHKEITLYTSKLQLSDVLIGFIIIFIPLILFMF